MNSFEYCIKIENPINNVNDPKNNFVYKNCVCSFAFYFEMDGMFLWNISNQNKMNAIKLLWINFEKKNWIDYFVVDQFHRMLRKIHIRMYEKSSIFSSSKRFILEDNISIYATLVSKPQFKQQQKSRRKAV